MGKAATEICEDRYIRREDVGRLTEEIRDDGDSHFWDNLWQLVLMYCGIDGKGIYKPPKSLG